VCSSDLLGFALESNQAVETINAIAQERLGKNIL